MWHRFPAKLYTFIINDTGRIKITYCRYFKEVKTANFLSEDPVSHQWGMVIHTAQMLCQCVQEKNLQ